MSAAVYHRTSCRLCGSPQLTRVLELPPTPPANAFVPIEKVRETQDCYPLDVWFCGACSHLQLLDVVDPAILFRDYVYVSGTSPSFVRHFENYAADCIARFTPPKGALAVDIGSNDGTLLQFLKSAGMDVLGIDPARAIAEAATARGIETWPEFLDRDLVGRVIAQKGQAAIVTANNVFAHVDDLAGFTDCVHELLDAAGIFVFEVSYAGAVHAHVLFDTIYHEHLAYHTVKPLVPFFAAHGLDFFSVRKVPTHGGSIRGFAQRAGGPHTHDGSVEALMAEETAHKLDSIESWQAFADRIERLDLQLSGLLRDIKAKGQRIAGFGAPAKATTLMYRFGLGPEIVDYIVDDSPLKQNLFTPGHHIPVVSWSKTAELKPDYLLVLAWNFADSIIANHSSYLDSGGHFIIPLPGVKIV